MIKDLKQLQKFMKLCREQGVESIKFDGVEVYFGQLPVKIKQKIGMPSSLEEMGQELDPGAIEYAPLPADKIDSDEMTDEQKLFGSSDPTVWNQKQQQ